MNNNQPTKNSNQPSRSMWTLSYRLKGLTICLALAAIYCYFFLHYWHKSLLIAAIIFGYFLGWAVGNFTYRQD
jgi:hypothetical protein